MTAFTRLTAREKRLLILAAVLGTAMAAWFYGWQPILAQRDMQQGRIARYLSLIDLAQRAPDTAPTPPRQCANGGQLAPRVTQSAERAGIPLARLDPEGQILRIAVSDTRYADAVAWIAELETQACVRATAIDMSRLTKPGKVSLDMTLEDAGT